MKLPDLVTALRERSLKVEDRSTAHYLTLAADALEPHTRRGRPRRTATDSTLIDTLRADRAHLQDYAEWLRAEREGNAAELARCVRRLRASGKCPIAILEDLQALDAAMTASATHHPRKAHR